MTDATASIVAQFEAQIEENNTALANVNDDAVDNYIVVCEEVAIGFTIENNRVVKSFSCGGAIKATRFSSYNATNVAKTVRNGRGTVALAWYIKDALKEENERIQSCIEMLRTKSV